MLYTIGALTVEVAPFNIHDFYESGRTDYAAKPVAGAEQPMEFVGEGTNELSLSGQLFPRHLGGLDELDLLRQMRVSGKPQYIMRGDGTPYGWWVITDVNLRSRFLDRDGVGKQIEMTIGLTRSKKPADQSFFSLIAGLI